MKKTNLFSLRMIILVFLVFSCKEVPTMVIPVVKTMPVTAVAGSSATGGGEIVSDGGGRILRRGVCWDTLADPTIQGNKMVDSSGGSPFSVRLTGLKGGTKYYVRAFADNAAGVAYGENVDFTTCQVPEVNTTAPTEITDSSAVTGGVVIEDYGVEITAAGVCWSLSAEPTTEDAKTVDPVVHGIIRSRMTGLLPDTVYHVRAYISTVNGDTGYGNEYVFRTMQPDSVRFVFTELMRDVQFEKGFALTPLDPAIVQQGGGFEKTYVDTLDFGRGGSHPVWMIAQWQSKYSLAEAPLTSYDGGAVGYENPGKKVILYPDHSLWMEVDASNEYDHPRTNGEPWPHLLIAQSIGDAGGYRVGNAERLDFSMEIKIEKCENKMDPGTYDLNLHTAQAPFYFFLVNGNPASPDYNQRLWFGLPSFDYRYATTRSNEVVIWDIGTSTYIYGVPETKIWGKVSLQDGQWHKTHIDIKPLISKALTVMRSKGVFKNTTLDDLKIKDMNFGWEVPGTFDAALRVRGISLVSVEAKDED